MDKKDILREVNRLVSVGLGMEAIKKTEAFLEKFPDDPRMLQALGKIYLSEKQPEKAVKYLQLSLQKQKSQNKLPTENKYAIDDLNDEDFHYIDQNAAELPENDNDINRSNVPQAQSINVVTRETSEIDNESLTSRVGSCRNNPELVDDDTKKSTLSIRIETKSDDLDSPGPLPQDFIERQSGNLILQKPNALLEPSSLNEENPKLIEDIPPYDKTNTELEFCEDEIYTENNNELSETIDEIYSDEPEEKSFSWDDVDEFDDIDDEEKHSEIYPTHIATNGKLNRWERAKQIAVEVIKEYDWSKENLPLLQQVFYENGWAAARYSIERELSKGLTPAELAVALFIRGLWAESEQYWISFIHVKSNQAGQWTRAAYKNMSWPESLRIIRSFTSLPSEEEIQYFIDETYDDWICSVRLQRSFKAFIRYLKFRTGSVRGSLPGNELFSFTSPYEEELFLDLSYDNIKFEAGIEELKSQGIDIEQILIDKEQKYQTVKLDQERGDPDIYGDLLYV